MPRPRAPRAEYLARIHRVQDHVERHLAEDLRLEDLARIARFSPFHFSRVYAGVTGETLRAFVLRLRLERAASQLRQFPGRSVTEVALDNGFGGSAAFARAFRAAFGRSASEWRKPRKTIRNAGKEVGEGERYVPGVGGRTDDPAAPAGGTERNMKGVVPKPAVEVKVEDRPAFTVAYVRHVGPYAGDSELFGRLYGQLTRWAGPRGLLGPGARMLTVSHDDPEVTPPGKLRISCCLTVPPGTVGEHGIGIMELPAARTAAARFELDPTEYPAAWSWVFGTWLPESGYQPADALPYEVYLADHGAQPGRKHLVEICVPVKPL